MANNYYDLTRARGGKHDIAVEEGLIERINALKAGSAIEITLREVSPWKGRDEVNIQDNGTIFRDRKDHTFSPVGIKSAVRVLHAYGFRGLFHIEVSKDTIIIQPASITKRQESVGKESSSKTHHYLDNMDDDTLWALALANPIPLFLTLEEDSLVALFDDKGFFLSEETQEVYNNIKSKPHIYVARFESNDMLYIGISNQQGGRWKRQHAYHLGGLAYQILGTTRYDDQNHSSWVRSWFEKFQNICHGSKYHIRMKQRVIISFYVPDFPVTRDELKRAESRLISIAKSKRLRVLNIAG